MEEARATLGWFRAWARAGQFTLEVTAAALARRTYSAQARSVALRQFYFTAWQVLPGYLLFAAALTLVLVQIVFGVARSFGLGPFATEMVFRVLVLELLPFGTALLVALRSGSAISTEVALMRVSGELDAMREANVDPMAREFVPRVLAAAASVLALTVLSCAMALAIAYLSLYGLSPWGFEPFTHDIAVVFDGLVLTGLALKCLAFGIAVAVIPIAAGLDALGGVKSAPVAVMGGMVRLVLMLAVIEIAALAVKYV